MNKRQNAQYNMLSTVETHFRRHEEIWSSDVLISDTKAALSAKIAQVMAAAVLQGDTSMGATEDKAALRDDLKAKTFFITTAICAYTSLNPGNKELRNAVFITKTNLYKLREAELLLYVEDLYQAVLPILEDLAPYRVTQATIDDMMAARTAFHDMMKLPKEIRSSRKDATKDISDLLSQAIALLNDTMDQLIGLLKATEPQFVNVYFLERKIHKSGTRTLSLEITTINAADKTPLADVHIEVVGKKIKRISSENGLNKVQNLKEGNYTLSVSRENFVSQMIPFTVMNHQTTQLVVELEEVVKNQRLKGNDFMSN